MPDTAPRSRPPRLQPLRILIVEDDPHARQLLAEVLETFGAQVRAAESVEAAIVLLGGYTPDLVVSDLGMPGQSGYDLIRVLRALPRERGGAAPAIACSSFARPEDRLRLIDAGYQEVVAKPVDVAVLLSTIARLGGGSDASDLTAPRRRGGGCRASLR